jgi:hypothetical protein
MAFTVTQYQAICDAIGTGQLMVQYDGKKVEYRSIAELIAAKNHIEQDLIATGQLAAPSSSAGVERGGSTFASYDPS